jgi:hypothetical protein
MPRNVLDGGTLVFERPKTYRLLLTYANPDCVNLP